MKPISELVGEFMGEQDVNRMSRETYKSAITPVSYNHLTLPTSDLVYI